MSFLLTMNVEVKPSRLLSASIHNRAHPRHYRAEYVRGYLHRQADVYSLPGWSSSPTKTIHSPLSWRGAGGEAKI